MDLLSNFLREHDNVPINKWSSQIRKSVRFSSKFFDQMTIYINLQGLIQSNLFS